MILDLKYQRFLAVFAAWDAAYRIERDTVQRLYGSRLQRPADEDEVRRLLAELEAQRRKADELLALVSGRFEDWASSRKTLH
jgi:hypothetical protein